MVSKLILILLFLLINLSILANLNNVQADQPVCKSNIKNLEQSLFVTNIIPPDGNLAYYLGNTYTIDMTYDTNLVNTTNLVEGQNVVLHVNDLNPFGGPQVIDTFQTSQIIQPLPTPPPPNTLKTITFSLKIDPAKYFPNHTYFISIFYPSTLPEGKYDSSGNYFVCNDPLDGNITQARFQVFPAPSTPIPPTPTPTPIVSDCTLKIDNPHSTPSTLSGTFTTGSSNLYTYSLQIFNYDPIVLNDIQRGQYPKTQNALYIEPTSFSPGTPYYLTSKPNINNAINLGQDIYNHGGGFNPSGVIVVGMVYSKLPAEPTVNVCNNSYAQIYLSSTPPTPAPTSPPNSTPTPTSTIAPSPTAIPTAGPTLPPLDSQFTYCDYNKQGAVVDISKITPTPGDKIGILSAIGCIPTQPVEFIKGFLKFVIAVGGATALLLMFSGAFKMIVSQGDAKSLHEGQQQLVSAIIGLLFIIFSVLLLQIIGAQILNIPGFS